MIAAIATWFLTTKLGRIVGGAALCALLLVGARLWLAAHDASTRHDALAGYVLQSKLDAAEAKNAEINRQLAAGRTALSQYAELLADEQAKNRASDEAAEQRIADYEKLLAAQGHARLITDADRQFLLDP